MKIIGKIGKTLVFFSIFSNFYLGFPMILSILAALGSPRPPHPCRPRSPPPPPPRCCPSGSLPGSPPSLSVFVSLSLSLSVLLASLFLRNLIKKSIWKKLCFLCFHFSLRCSKVFEHYGGPGQWRAARIAKHVGNFENT